MSILKQLLTLVYRFTGSVLSVTDARCNFSFKKVSFYFVPFVGFFWLLAYYIGQGETAKLVLYPLDLDK